MENTENLLLPYILPSQAQKHVTHNEALRVLDAVVQLCAESASLNSPPAEPAAGELYIVPLGAGGAWAQREASVAIFQDGGWRYLSPAPGWRCWVVDARQLIVWDGSAWVGAAGPNASIETLSVNGAEADNNSRIAVSAQATLLSHEGAGHRLVVNKAGSVDTASVLFQTDFSGRAEAGLCGDDNWHLKISADGDNWIDALVVAGTDGKIGLGTAAPNYPLHLHRPGAFGSSIQLTNGTSGSGASDGFWFGFSDRAYFWNYENTDTQFATNNQARMVIKADGKIGIGTLSPSAALEVTGAVTSGRYETAARPGAAAAGAGAQIYDTSLSMPVWSDGTVWRNALGTAV